MYKMYTLRLFYCITSMILLQIQAIDAANNVLFTPFILRPRRFPSKNMEIQYIMTGKTPEYMATIQASSAGGGKWVFNQWSTALDELEKNVDASELQSELYLSIDFNIHYGITRTRELKFDLGRENRTYGPILGFAQDGLSGMPLLKKLAISNFRVLFSNDGWLNGNDRMKSLQFDTCLLDALNIDNDASLDTVIIRDSVLASFPTDLLQLSSSLSSFVVEGSRLPIPNLTISEFNVLNTIPNLQLNNLNVTGVSECDNIEKVQDLTVCILTTSNLESATIKIKSPTNRTATSDNSGISSSSNELFDSTDSSLPAESSSRLSKDGNNSFVTILGVVLISIVMLTAFIVIYLYTRRRKLSSDSEKPAEELLNSDSETSRNLPMQHSKHHLSGSDMKSFHKAREENRPPQSSRHVKAGALSNVAPKWNFGNLYLGNDVVSLEKSIGVDGMFYAEYEGRQVVAYRVDTNIYQISQQQIDEILISFQKLRHPNIIQLIGVSMQNLNDIVFATEYMPKGTLKSLIASENTSLSWSQKVNMVADICQGLLHVESIYLHDANEQPLDNMSWMNSGLSSQYIYCSDDLVCNLDCYRYVKWDVHHTQRPTYSYGATEYIITFAPELLRADRDARKTFSAEVYALGIIMCELSLDGPLCSDFYNDVGSTMADIIFAQQITNGTFIPEANPYSPVAYKELSKLCTHYVPEERPLLSDIYQTLMDMKDELAFSTDSTKFGVGDVEF